MNDTTKYLVITRLRYDTTLNAKNKGEAFELAKGSFEEKFKMVPDDTDIEIRKIKE